MSITSLLVRKPNDFGQEPPVNYKDKRDAMQELVLRGMLDAIQQDQDKILRNQRLIEMGILKTAREQYDIERGILVIAAKHREMEGYLNEKDVWNILFLVNCANNESQAARKDVERLEEEMEKLKQRIPEAPAKLLRGKNLGVEPPPRKKVKIK